VCSQLIESLFHICSDLVKMHENSNDGNLYSNEWSHDNLITRGAKVINQTCFYGRAVGFQFSESICSALKFLNVTLACFSEAYFTNGFKFMRTTNYFLKHPTYFMDPEMCARRIINVSHNADVKFCKVMNPKTSGIIRNLNLFISVILDARREQAHARDPTTRRLQSGRQSSV
jgi:hypothetical protein